MNILFVNHSASLTGATISCFQIMTRLGDGFRAVFATGESGPMLDRLGELGIMSRLLTEKGILGLKYILSFRRIIEDEKIDLLHLNTLTPICKYAAIAGRLKGVPNVWFVRENPLISRSRRLRPYLKRLSSKIVFVDSDTKEKLLGSQCPEKVEVVRNGVDLEEFNPFDSSHLKEKFNIDAGAPLIGYIGLITKRKGVEYLVKAFHEIKKAHEKAKLFIIGGHKPEEESYYRSIRDLVSKLSLEDDVYFTGSITEVGRAINSLDIVVLPSLEERCSRTLLEAIACEKPVVATAVGGTPEIVEDGSNGFLVEPENPEQLTGALMRLLGDETLRQEMGRKGRRKAEKVFDIKRNINRIQEVYMGALS
jgi:glycosyltransferase involved in cell wall biosynthesis